MSARDWPPGRCMRRNRSQVGSTPATTRSSALLTDLSHVSVLPVAFSPKAHCENAIGRSCYGAAWLRWLILLRTTR